MNRNFGWPSLLLAGLMVASLLLSAQVLPAAPVSASQAAALAPINGPLHVLAANPRYFTNASGKAVYLSGSHTWLNLQDGVLTDPPPAFNYSGWLDFLVARNHNFFRLWYWEEAKWVTESSSPYYFTPLPYPRTGPGTALDGKPKFNVSQFNQTYFDRLRQRVIMARDKGIYVSIMLFDGWSVSANKGGNALANPWKGHPFNGNNNINGINGDPNNTGSGDAIQTMAIPAVTQLQDAYVKKVVASVNDLDNVLYEINNEGNVGSATWQYHMIDLIHSYEKTLPKQHPVGMTVEWPNGSNSTVYASNADWISPNGDINNPVVADGRKVVVADTDHLCGICGSRVWVWKAFTRGENPLFMDQYDDSYKLNGGGYNLNNANDVSLRANLGYTLNYAGRMNLAAMTPRGDLASTGYALANPSASGAAYLVYQPSGGSFTVNLSATAGTLNVEWFNPAAGTAATAAAVSGGATRTFTPPFSGDAVLYLSQGSAPAPTATATAQPLVTNTPTRTPTAGPTPTRTPTLAATPISSAPAGLVAAYSFNEGTGTIVHDSSGKGNQGTVASPAWTTAGRFGGALTFGTTAQRVSVPDSTSLHLSTGMTIEAWVYPTAGLTSNAWRTVLMKEQSGEFVYTLYGNGDLNQPYAYIYSSSAEHGLGGGGTLPLNTWTHLAATYDGSTMRLYRNGALVSSLSYASSIQSSTGPLDIGANMVWTEEVFNGRIDEVRLYNSALTAAQIQTDMNKALP